MSHETDGVSSDSAGTDAVVTFLRFRLYRFVRGAGRRELNINRKGVTDCKGRLFAITFATCCDSAMKGTGVLEANPHPRPRLPDHLPRGSHSLPCDFPPLDGTNTTVLIPISIGIGIAMSIRMGLSMSIGMTTEVGSADLDAG